MTAQNAFIAELEDALSHGSAERRAKTLRRVTDLFVFGSSHFSADHIAVFDGVFNHLIADIELSARVTLADRLAALSNAPPKVIRSMAIDDAIAVAGPVLVRSELLDNVTLVETARTKSQHHLLAISRRKSIAETVTDVLVARAGKFEETAAALTILCELPIDIIERAMVQDREETILIVAKAGGLSWPTVKAVLRLCAGKRGMSAQALEQNMTVFNKLKRETAQQVIEFQRKRRTAQAFPVRG